MKTLDTTSSTPEYGPKKLGDNEPGKKVTFIPEAGQLDALMGLAVVDATGDESVTLADELRGAVSAYVNHRRSSPMFHAEVQEAMARQQTALEMLNRTPPQA